MNMFKLQASRYQRGIAAVELALLLPVFLILLALPIYFGRILWHYSAAKTAAYDAARYLSSVPVIEIKDPNRIAAVLQVARDIVEEELEQLNPGPYRPTVAINCGGGFVCGGLSIPATVEISIQVHMEDIFFTQITSAILGSESLLLSTEVILPYTGN